MTQLKDFRENFIDTFLTESPKQIKNSDYYPNLVSYIRELEEFVNPEDLGNNLKKIELRDLVYYWFEKDSVIQLAVLLDKKQYSLIVRLIGKNKTLKGQSPFASDLYDAILKDSKDSIRIVSDNQLSDEGYTIWKRLFDAGNKISVYDAEFPGASNKLIHSIEDFDNYFGDSDKYRNYQFIISESINSLNILSLFNVRRSYELAGTL